MNSKEISKIYCGDYASALYVGANLIWRKVSTGRFIYYTSTNGNIVSPKDTGWGANIISNTYVDGQGCIEFDEIITNIPSFAFGYINDKLQTITFPLIMLSNLSFCFSSCTSLVNADTSNLDTSNVRNMGYVFNGCNSLTTLDVSKWNTSNVTSMGYLFSSCKSLTTLDVSKWNTSNVTSMSFMFNGCTQLASLDVSNWNTSKVTEMGSLFSGCSGLTSLDLSNWNAAKVTNTSNMFTRCSSLTTLIGGRTGLDEKVLNGCHVELDLSYTKLDRPSLRAVINGLADLSGTTSQPTLQLGALKGRLTEEDIAIATNKNWIIG